MRSLRIVVCGTLLWLFPLSIPALGQSLEEAERNFLDHRIGEALELYKALAQSAGDTADRAEAAGMAALIQWRFFRSHDDAAQLLKAAMASGCKKVEPLLALSRLELDRQCYEEARSAAQQAVKAAQSGEDSRKGRIQWSRAVVTEHVNAALNGNQTADIKTLREAEADLIALAKDHQEDFLEVSQLLLHAAILLGDGDTALQAWHSYFQVTPDEKAYGVLGRPQQELLQIWPTWKAMAGPQETNGRLVKALGDSRLYEEALILARRYGVADEPPEDIQDILVYAQAMGELKEFLNEQYRGYFFATSNPGTFFQGFVERLCALWNASSWSKGPCPAPVPFNPDDPAAMTGGMRVLAELFKRFGTVVMVGSARADVYMGHAIIQQPREIDHHGKRAQMTYLLVDGVVSNGWTDWATDGRVRAGGYVPVIENQFAQVRYVYVHEPLAAWRKATDPAARREFENQIRKDSKEDWDRAEKNPYAYLPGLKGRMELAAYDDLLNQLKQRGLEGDRLRLEFMRAIEEVRRETDIVAHEGRHAIDRQLGITDGAELEFRGKLSQVVFAPVPRLAFNGLLVDASTAGPDTPHGRANRRIWKGVVTWMKSNPDHIAGLDTSKPMLPQFDLLTDEQMRAVMRSMDPLATNAG